MTNEQRNALIDMLKRLTGRNRPAIRALTPEQATRMNVPNALVDPRVRGGKVRGADRIMFMPQGTYQALESLTRDTGVNWGMESQANALMTFLHEAGHMRNGPKWQNERRQQRFALGHMVSAAKQLGVDPDKAQKMYEWAVEYTRKLPKDYHPRNLP